MASYIFGFTQKNARKAQLLRQQASTLLGVGISGIGDKMPYRDRLIPADRYSGCT